MYKRYPKTPWIEVGEKEEQQNLVVIFWEPNPVLGID
jgi:hypothetical protein